MPARSSDLRLAVDLFDHPKWLRLGEALGAAGQLSLLRLWSWAARHRPKGLLTGLTMAEVDLVAGFRPVQGSSTTLAEVLQGISWIDVNPSTGLISLHDWSDHQPWIFFSDERSDRARRGAVAREKARRGQNQPSRKSTTAAQPVQGSSSTAAQPVNELSTPTPTPPPAPKAGGGGVQTAAAQPPPAPKRPSEPLAGRRRAEPEPEPLDSDRQAEALRAWDAGTVAQLADEAMATTVPPGAPRPSNEIRDGWRTALSVLARQGASPLAVRQTVAAFAGRLPADPQRAYSVLREALQHLLPVPIAHAPTGA